jgi:glyoxylase-like metal-dependent hydrolase (beta-lactamase superfamily II)
MTLLVGTERALLFDTGYGLFDVRALVRAITPLPLTVLISHHHHDHALGARWFDEAYLPEGEMAELGRYTGGGQRRRILARAEESGVPLSPAQREAYLTFAMPPIRPLSERVFELGGLRARVWPMPGHTRDSVGLMVEEERLLLAGDNLNPVVWLFFSDSTPLAQYACTMRNALYLPFAHALCPHAGEPMSRRAVEDYVEGLRPDVFRTAEKVSIPPYGRFDTRSCVPANGFTLVFDGKRAEDAAATCS